MTILEKIVLVETDGKTWLGKCLRTNKIIPVIGVPDSARESDIIIANYGSSLTPNKKPGLCFFDKFA